MDFMLIKASKNSVSEITGFSLSLCSSSPHGEVIVSLEIVLLEPISGSPSTSSPSPSFNLDLVSIQKNYAQIVTCSDTKLDPSDLNICACKSYECLSLVCNLII